MPEPIAFNVHAELYEDEFGDLAVRLEGDHVYRIPPPEASARFQDEAAGVLQTRKFPADWQEMQMRELIYGHGWNRVGRMGYVDGDEARPAVELEVESEKLGAQARSYLQDVLHR